MVIKKELVPIATKTDREHLFPTELVNKMFKMGLMSINVPGEFGGAEMSALAYAVSSKVEYFVTKNVSAITSKMLAKILLQNAKNSYNAFLRTHVLE